jgi:hypothetical protein
MMNRITADSLLLLRRGAAAAENRNIHQDGNTEEDEWTLRPTSNTSTTTTLLPRSVRIHQRQSPNKNAAGEERQILELQTAVVTLERVIAPFSTSQNSTSLHQRVDVHALVHFGSFDYFDYFNRPTTTNNYYDAVHYELLVDESLLCINASSGMRYMPPHAKDQLLASPHDQQLAHYYGLSCQVQVIDYTQPHWIHSDLTRQELLNAIAASSTTKSTLLQRLQQQPLWALASSTTPTTWPGVEAVVALLRPLTPTTTSVISTTTTTTTIPRRLFSNLFLPGTTLTIWLRALFWFTLPCPELSVLLLDWSSLWPPPSSGTLLSPIALPVWECLWRGHVQSARQLILAQMLVSSQQQPQQLVDKPNESSLLMDRRNDHAWNIISTSLQKNDHDMQSVAILYGSSHIPDLTRRLMQIMGFVPVQTKWRTAWSVAVPAGVTLSSDNKDDDMNNKISHHHHANDDQTAATTFLLSRRAVFTVGFVLLPLYFGIGGWDWISTLQQVAQELEHAHVADAAIQILLYLIRHALLYLGLAKFVVAWDTTNK